MHLVDLVGIQMDPLLGTYVLVLREHEAPNRLLPIIVGGAEAISIAMAAQGQTVPRPMTHDLMATLVETFDGHLDAVEVTDLNDGAFLATLAVSGPAGERRLDTRPSDAIALAVRLHAPLFVSEHVLDEAGTLPEPEGDDILDDELIDAEVDQFRDFLADLDPADFVTDVVDADVVEVVVADVVEVVDADVVEVVDADVVEVVDAEVVDADVVDDRPED